MTINIIGAGMAGLLAARMLARYKPIVWEAKEDLPHNHSAVLRFRTSAVGDILGIPFRRVRMVKSAIPWLNPVADDLAYSLKVAGMRRTDRSIPRSTVEAERWIAPPDLIEQMADGVDVRLGHEWKFFGDDPRVISTIPMPALMEALNYPKFYDGGKVEFSSSRGTNISARIRRCEAYASVYVPDLKMPFSRVSITGDELIIECRDEIEEENISGIVLLACRMILGIDHIDVSEVKVHHQEYAKILPIDEGVRRTFIHWASTVQGRAFSLGRYATWRPGLLLDDLIHDVRVIEGLMNSSSPGYDAERLERIAREPKVLDQLATTSASRRS